jgi:hypothetical protein
MSSSCPPLPLPSLPHVFLMSFIAGICTCATLFIFFFVPETKGKSAEDFVTEYKGEKVSKFEVRVYFF